ncbi:MAG: Hint domain-containing protein [Maritimibacter sp.]
MTTGFRGTFVISWLQTEIDGSIGAPRGALGVGASWRWSGTAVRVDGPQDVLSLTAPTGEADIRKRAARKVQKMVGAALKPGSKQDALVLEDAVEDPLFDHGFVITDGYKSYKVSVVELGAGSAPLLLFLDEVPPAGTDFWVVQAMTEAAEINRLTDQPTGVICFTPGTRIRTDHGDVAIQDIRPGDKVQTKDNGFQDVRWIGTKRVSGARLFAMPELRPIRLRRGALGVDRPDEDLIVSPLHKMLVQGARAQALFNTDEVLVTARDLIDDRLVIRDHTMSSVTYVHLLLDQHEVVFANGLETESFHPGPDSLAAVEDDQRNTLFQQMPELERAPQTYGDHARRSLNKAEAAIMQAHI